eukprot:GHVS01083433.1.p1 GENE.GHVS01083433.1~~GHVS01083433.1.p1  ORF type:complete len:1088 (+),score=103.48 GHVS01083433.1:102-3365(+)
MSPPLSQASRPVFPFYDSFEPVAPQQTNPFTPFLSSSSMRQTVHPSMLPTVHPSFYSSIHAHSLGVPHQPTLSRTFSPVPAAPKRSPQTMDPSYHGHFSTLPLAHFASAPRGAVVPPASSSDVGDDGIRIVVQQQQQVSAPRLNSNQRVPSYTRRSVQPTVRAAFLRSSAVGAASIPCVSNPLEMTGPQLFPSLPAAPHTAPRSVNNFSPPVAAIPHPSPRPLMTHPGQLSAGPPRVATARATGTPSEDTLTTTNLVREAGLPQRLRWEEGQAFEGPGGRSAGCRLRVRSRQWRWRGGSVDAGTSSSSVEGRPSLLSTTTPTAAGSSSAPMTFIASTAPEHADDSLPNRQHREGRRRSSRRSSAERADVSMDYDNLLDLQERVGHISRGLSLDQLELLPEEGYNGASEESRECLICRVEYETTERLRRLPCWHVFHSRCIDKWLHDRNTCPLCRLEVDQALVAQASFGPTDSESAESSIAIGSLTNLQHAESTDRQPVAPSEGPLPENGIEENQQPAVVYARLPAVVESDPQPLDIGSDLPAAEATPAAERSDVSRNAIDARSPYGHPCWTSVPLGTSLTHESGGAGAADCDQVHPPVDAEEHAGGARSAGWLRRRMRDVWHGGRSVLRVLPHANSSTGREDGGVIQNNGQPENLANGGPRDVTAGRRGPGRYEGVRLRPFGSRDTEWQSPSSVEQVDLHTSPRFGSDSSHRITDVYRGQTADPQDGENLPAVANISPPTATGVRTVEQHAEDGQQFRESLFWSTPQPVNASSGHCSDMSHGWAAAVGFGPTYNSGGSTSSLEPSLQLHHEETIRRYLMCNDRSESVNRPTSADQGVNHPIDGRCRAYAEDAQLRNAPQVCLEQQMPSSGMCLGAEPSFPLMPPDIIQAADQRFADESMFQGSADSSYLPGFRRVASANVHFFNEADAALNRSSSRRNYASRGSIHRSEDNRVSSSVPATPTYRGQLSETGRHSLRRTEPTFALQPSSSNHTPSHSRCRTPLHTAPSPCHPRSVRELGADVTTSCEKHSDWMRREGIPQEHCKLSRENTQGLITTPSRRADALVVIPGPELDPREASAARTARACIG